MTDPLPYPRVPYLWEPDGGATGDRVVPVAERAAWLRRPVVVEEKLDGANVAIWWADGRPQVASRGGPGAMDRAGQLGPLRARVDKQYGPLRALLAAGDVLYAEWLWLTHTVGYDRLPDHLVALDIWGPDAGFTDLPDRDGRLRRSGLVGPPRLFAGVLATADALLALMDTSRFGSNPMEGVVLRRTDGRICKVVRPGFVRAGNDRIGRTRNALVERPAAGLQRTDRRNPPES